MIDSLNGVTSMAVGVALDGLAQRQQLIAANLANLNSGNHSTRDLDFEAVLGRALVDGRSSVADAVQSLLELKRELRDGAHVRQSAAQPVEIDTQMLRLNETVIRYQALIEGLSKYGSLTRMAIAGEVKV